MSEDEPFQGAVQDTDPFGGREKRGDRTRDLTSDDERETYRRTFDSRTESVGMAVISAVAAISNTDPKEMEPLHHVLDIDALDTIFRPGSDGHVTFPYNGYEVVVGSDETITITPDAG